jgi:hypothetical protein
MLFTASAASAQTPDLSGHWKGTIEIPNNPMDFEIDLARDAGGGLMGTVTAGADKVTVPLQKIAVHGSQITLYARADQPLSGEISASGKAIAGTATLSGYSLPFSMSRTGDATIAPPPASPAVSKQLEGGWKGALSTGTRELRFVVTIENRGDGTSLARQISIDEGGLLLYLVVAEDGRKVKMDAPAVAASFAGELNAAGTEISGTWSQRETVLPLTMTRAAAERAR